MTSADLRTLGVGRRRADDQLFTPGDTLCRLYVREGIVDIDDDQLSHQVVDSLPCKVAGCDEVLTSHLEFEMHYHQRHRFMCSQCRKALPSAHLLDLHLSETHDSFFAVQAQRKPMFRCFVEDCSVVSEDEASRHSHCIEAHNFPHDFRYDQSHKKSKKPKDPPNTANQGGDGKPRAPKHFTFGSTKGKTFMTPWHKQGKSQSLPPAQSEASSALSTAELMDTLPTL